jgi:pimeloyl-ACP methyl ester carboxylesterase
MRRDVRFRTVDRADGRRPDVSDQTAVKVEMADELRAQLLAGTSIRDHVVGAAGVSTAVLEHGTGDDIVLLHGPGEFAAGWIETIIGLSSSHHVVATMVEWLGAAIAATCSGPPIIVGRVLGGALAMRYCLAHPADVRRLVLVDTMGLSPFEPAPPFGEALERFLAAPSERSHSQLMEYCSHDFSAVRSRLGVLWPVISAYAVDRIGDPQRMHAVGALMASLGGEIPKTELARIELPTTLIWGRDDLATPLRVAESANRALGWPLIVIDDAADDPGFDQPEAFLAALHEAFTTGGDPQ